MYNYYCDCCGHAFDTPERRGRGWLCVDGRDEDYSKYVCPLCGSEDYEELKEENDDSIDVPDYLRAHMPLDSGFYTANI